MSALPHHRLQALAFAFVAGLRHPSSGLFTPTPSEIEPAMRAISEAFAQAGHDNASRVVSVKVPECLASDTSPSVVPLPCDAFFTLEKTLSWLESLGDHRCPDATYQCLLVWGEALELYHRYLPWSPALPDMAMAFIQCRLIQSTKPTDSMLVGLNLLRTLLVPGVFVMDDDPDDGVLVSVPAVIPVRMSVDDADANWISDLDFDAIESLEQIFNDAADRLFVAEEDWPVFLTKADLDAVCQTGLDISLEDLSFNDVDESRRSLALKNDEPLFVFGRIGFREPHPDLASLFFNPAGLVGYRRGFVFGQDVFFQHLPEACSPHRSGGLLPPMSIWRASQRTDITIAFLDAAASFYHDNILAIAANQPAFPAIETTDDNDLILLVEDRDTGDRVCSQVVCKLDIHYSASDFSGLMISVFSQLFTNRPVFDGIHQFPTVFSEAARIYGRYSGLVYPYLCALHAFIVSIDYEGVDDYPSGLFHALRFASALPSQVLLDIARANGFMEGAETGELIQEWTEKIVNIDPSVDKEGRLYIPIMLPVFIGGDLEADCPIIRYHDLGYLAGALSENLDCDFCLVNHLYSSQDIDNWHGDEITHLKNHLHEIGEDDPDLEPSCLLQPSVTYSPSFAENFSGGVFFFAGIARFSHPSHDLTRLIEADFEGGEIYSPGVGSALNAIRNDSLGPGLSIMTTTVLPFSFGVVATHVGSSVLDCYFKHPNVFYAGVERTDLVGDDWGFVFNFSADDGRTLVMNLRLEGAVGIHDFEPHDVCDFVSELMLVVDPP